MKNKQIKNINVLLILAVLVGSVHDIWAQEFQHPDLWSFESVNKNQWQLDKGHTLMSSGRHYKHGEKSLEWRWKKQGSITLNHHIGFEPFNPESDDKSIPSFAVWVYNEKPVDDYMTFSFGTDAADNCHFKFNLNFKGWRSAWVSFERDMEGQPVTTMNRLRIDAPQSLAEGNLFIDHMFLCINIDSRHHTPDNQVPFVNKGTKSHWLIQESASHLKPDVEAPDAISGQDIKAFRTIEQRFEKNILRKQKVTEHTVQGLKKQVSHYRIVRKKKQVSGLPVWFSRNAELYIPLAGHNIAKLYRENHQDIKSYFDLMFKVAMAYENCQDALLKSELRYMFMDMYDHMVDQGVAAGSGLGTIHHYGYNWRSYYPALFIMRDVLRKENKLQDAIDGLQWFSAIGDVFIKPGAKGMDMDAFNTQVMGRLASILIMEDSPLKVQYLKCFSRWIDNGLQPAPGLNDAFKIDGSSYHHANNYPAYATGGMNGAVQMVYFLSGTPYKVSETGHATLKKALLTMRFYCNLLEWPVSMSGRHPKGSGKLHPNHFAVLAQAGSPDGKESVDKELAEAYMRLMRNKKNDRLVREFKAKGFSPEPHPQGNLVMPYAAVAVQRRDNWAVSVRAHSRYLWAAEHYIGANLYGRYLAHGALQIMGSGDPVNNRASGFVQEGWDWNRFPGTTVINVPLDDLRANILNVDQFSGYEEMLFSDEAFAGGVQAGHNGVFAFILHEHDKYQGSLRGRKSWFFFDDQVVCLGSGIENNNSERPTETILFQNHIGKKDGAVVINGQEVGQEDYEVSIKESNTWMLDNKGNGYVVSGASVKFVQGMQESRDQKTEKPTQGRFAAAVIEHGVAPHDGQYHYCVLPAANREKVAALAANPEYEVLVQAPECHIVSNKKSGEIGYVFFEAASNNDAGLIYSTNMPCVVMTSPKGSNLTLYVTNPDLALYEGPADEIYKDGKRVERSIYSRPWRPAESKPTNVEVELTGEWKVVDNAFETIFTGNGTTIVKLVCKDGLTREVNLEPIDL